MTLSPLTGHVTQRSSDAPSCCIGDRPETVWRPNRKQYGGRRALRPRREDVPGEYSARRVLSAIRPHRMYARRALMRPIGTDAAWSVCPREREREREKFTEVYLPCQNTTNTYTS